MTTTLLATGRKRRETTKEKWESVCNSAPFTCVDLLSGNVGYAPKRGTKRCLPDRRTKRKSSSCLLLLSLLLTISRHSQGEAFLQPAKLAPIPIDSIDDAVLLPGALVVDDAALRAPEEALAALARDHAVVDARRFVAAHLARDYFDLGCKGNKKIISIHSMKKGVFAKMQI